MAFGTWSGRFPVYTDLGRIPIVGAWSPPSFARFGCDDIESGVGKYPDETVFRSNAKGDGMDNGMRDLMTFARRVALVILLVCLGCQAQSTPSEPGEVMRTLERQVRVMFSV